MGIRRKRVIKPIIVPSGEIGRRFPAKNPSN
jgi:hypothetical protein